MESDVIRKLQAAVITLHEAQARLEFVTVSPSGTLVPCLMTLVDEAVEPIRPPVESGWWVFEKEPAHGRSMDRDDNQ